MPLLTAFVWPQLLIQPSKQQIAPEHAAGDLTDSNKEKEQTMRS